jgi:2-methylcitrate dehydratase PrpD
LVDREIRILPKGARGKYVSTNDSLLKENTPVTRLVAEKALETSAAAPPDIRRLIKQCLLDWIGVGLAGAREPLTRILRQELSRQGGRARATLIGERRKLPVYSAALLNGTASHALDYDDVNHAIPGHPSVPIIAALLALAEDIGTGGKEFMDAFLAGYETACRIGQLVDPGHYEKGFHATATIGGFGAAAACARLLNLDVRQTTYALGIAASRCGGLKSMFGTSCKPLQAGQAAQTGLLASCLAKEGFDSREDALECLQGFAAAYSEDFHPDKALAAPPGGFYILANLFKYNASCFETQAALECGHRLRRLHSIDINRIKSVELRVNPRCDKICNIQKPQTGLEAKFSLKLTTSFALAGIDTASPAVFTEANANAPALVALRDKVHVVLSPELETSENQMRIELIDGRHLEIKHNAGLPETDIAAQGLRLEAKFRALTAPLLPDESVTRILQLVNNL